MLYFGLLAVDLFVVPRAGESVLLNLLSLVSVGVRMMLPCIITGAYAFSTTTVGELTAALRRMHLPESIIIPCAVVARFFPTAGEDYRHIRAAMALRGIAAGRGALLRHPVQSLEYILMPLLMNSNNVAQDLSAAALTKGIGLPGRHDRAAADRVGFPLSRALHAAPALEGGDAAVIEAENASFTYQSAPSPALQDVTLTVQPGECVVLCGRSGCGKTTFTHLLNGLSPEFYPGTLTGRCTAAGLAAGEAAIEAYVPQVGSVFQNPKTQYFNVDTTAELAFPCENAGMEPQAIRRRVDEVVEQFQLGPLMDRSVFKLSGGEKQRVAFAAACMLGPRLLVLDEPTSNLDAAAIAQLHDMIAVMKRQGVTVVLAEHRLAWITDLADRYFFFAAGRLAAQWSAAEFAALPAGTLAGYGLRARTLDDCRAGIRAKQSARCPGTPVLTLEGVTLGCDKKHPLRTLPDMSFAAGEIVGLMGRNGIGKSTMARTLCGLLEPVSGKICRNGRPANARERLRSSFLVMQDVNYQLFSDSVREEVLLGAAHPERCDAVLQALGLDGLADKPLILLDEPTSGLDLGSMQQVGQLLQEWKAQGKTLLVITHDEELAANWCDRVIRWDDTEGV